MPSVKSFVRKVCKQKIKSICCNSSEVCYYKQKLLDWLRFKNYRHVVKDKEIKLDRDNNYLEKEPESQKVDSFPYRIHKRLQFIDRSDETDESDSEKTSTAHN